MGEEDGRVVSDLNSTILKYIQIRYSASQIVMSVKFKQPHFSKFSQVDLDRLKNDNQWLSDSHVTLGLLWVPIFFHL